MKLNSLRSFVLSLAVGAAVAHATPVIFNGNFAAGLAGWNTPLGQTDMVANPGGPFGSFLEIGGLGGGISNSIDQIVNGFNVGDTYVVSFSVASQWANLNSGGGSGARVRLSFLSGSSAAPAVFQAPDWAGFGAWNTFSYSFVATSSAVDIEFKQVKHGYDDIGISNILISGGESVPDSGTTVAMIGSACLGFAALRRKYSRA
jgi:hypothetical protein